MLVPHVTLDDILEVTRDYDRYKEFYRPSVVASKMIVKRVGRQVFDAGHEQGLLHENGA